MPDEIPVRARAFRARPCRSVPCHAGSGKTAAFVIPMLALLRAPLAGGQAVGPRAVVISPTRELALQTYRECVKLAFGKKFKIRRLTKALCSTHPPTHPPILPSTLARDCLCVRLSVRASVRANEGSYRCECTPAYSCQLTSQSVGSRSGP